MSADKKTEEAKTPAASPKPEDKRPGRRENAVALNAKLTRVETYKTKKD